MKRTSFRSLGPSLGALAGLLVFPCALSGGPPLICHPFDIGREKSLPWTSNTWNLSGQENYDLARLADETLALLTPQTPVIVRMETLRRATLYAQKNPQVSKELLLKLRARALDAEAPGHPNALAWFDVGYLVECYKQANWLFKKARNGSNGWVREEKPNPASDLDGYAWVEKAIQLRGQDPEMEFAAAFITLGGSSYPGHQEHLQKAFAGAKADPLLARNLAMHFVGEKSQTVSEMFKKRQTEN